VWYPVRPFSLRDARAFLRKDFSRVLRRTRYLYVLRRPTKQYGQGFFEPILLCMCWCDFLGALYCGDGKSTWAGGIGNSKRIRTFLSELMATVNPAYKTASRPLLSVYRNGTVHAFAPAGPFEIHDSEPARHLTKNGKRLVISIDDLIKDLLEATRRLAIGLQKPGPTSTHGSLAAFNKGRQELG
jgi:hypothetical protein